MDRYYLKVGDRVRRSCRRERLIGTVTDIEFYNTITVYWDTPVVDWSVWKDGDPLEYTRTRKGWTREELTRVNGLDEILSVFDPVPEFIEP